MHVPCGYSNQYQVDYHIQYDVQTCCHSNQYQIAVMQMSSHVPHCVSSCYSNVKMAMLKHVRLDDRYIYTYVYCLELPYYIRV